jgi:hypothetical protein
MSGNWRMFRGTNKKEMEDSDGNEKITNVRMQDQRSPRMKFRGSLMEDQTIQEIKEGPGISEEISKWFMETPKDRRGGRDISTP